jgi:hypothetical protein
VNCRLFITVVEAVIVAASGTAVLAQQTQSKCSQVKYSGRLTDAHVFQLRAIEGQAVYGEVSDKGELVSASAVCVALFKQKTKDLVASVQTELGGQFRFTNVASGKYVLIVSVSALHEINIPVEVSARPGTSTFKRWQLLLHLRSREDPRKSFVTPITQPALREELLAMERDDQAIRNEMIKNGSDHPDKAIEARMAAMDADSTARMKKIVQRYGWPDPDLVGRDGTDAAFLLVQHSPELAFQQAMLPLVRSSYESGKLSAWSYALLLDRVLTREGKPQVYGMSVNHWAGNEPVLYPIEDEANVDKRRMKIGLPPLSEYLERLKRQYFPGP